MFVHGLDPIPTNFADGDTIANLRDVSLLASGQGRPRTAGRGRPVGLGHAGWDRILKEDEIWDAVLFLYEFTGERPRARETHQ